MDYLTWAQPKTLAEWRDRIYLSLGGAQWNVELDEPSIDHAIWRTLTLFNKYRPVWRWRPLGLLVGEQNFDLSEEVELGVNVKDVKFMKDSESTFSPGHRHFFPFHGIYGVRSPRRIYSQLVAADRYDHFLGSGPMWKWDSPSRTLFINTKSYDGVRATALLLVPLKVEEIPFHLEVDFLDGAVGYTKKVLARILGKFGAIPAAQGNISTDAGELRSEGNAAVKELEEKLDRNLRHLPPRPIFG